MTLLLVAFVLAASIWVGGYITIAVVAFASRVLEPAQRVVFFRALGRKFLPVGLGALVVGLATGTALLADHPLDATLVSAVVVAVLMLAVLGLGVVQARRMTVLRVRALDAPQDPHLQQRVRADARSAAVLRGLIGLFTLVLVVLGSILAT